MFILWALPLRNIFFSFFFFYFWIKLWRDLHPLLFLPLSLLLLLLLLLAWRCQICRKVETLLLSSSRTSITVPPEKSCADRTFYETNAISFFFSLFFFFFFFFLSLRKPTVAHRFERHRLRMQWEKNRLGNQEKSHEDVSPLTHDQWHPMTGDGGT